MGHAKEYHKMGIHSFPAGSSKIKKNNVKPLPSK